VPLSKNLRRERSISITVGTTTFNVPGIYYPPYGKSVFLLSGRGSPGNASVPGNVSGDNFYTFSTYVPASGGNATGNINPATGGNATGNRNPAGPGTFAGTAWNAREDFYAVNSPQLVAPGWYTPGFTQTGTNNYSGVSPGSNSIPAPSSGQWGPFYYAAFESTYVIYYYTQYSSAGAQNNPATPGNPIYNPTVPGNPVYNPTGPGNPVYNPYSPAYIYNTDVPGNPNYNPTTPGTAGANYAVLGIPLPGGSAGSAASVVGFSVVTVNYSNSGVPISVPPGGYVSIQNKRPNT
jgi:hypothetical protein